MKANSVLKAALACAAKGLPVLLVGPDKRPLIKGNGTRWGATTDPARIARLFKKHPKANFGIATGGKSRLVVIDIDTLKGHKVDGLGSWRRLVAEHGKVPATYEVNTATGGRHLYLRVPEGRTIKSGKLADGIDIKAEGGYVVAPPSVVRTGKYVAQNNRPIADSSDWLLDLMAGDNDELNLASGDPTGDPERIARAFAPGVIANDDLDWEAWNNFGLAIYAASEGSDEGFEVFDKWSQQSKAKYDAKATRERWDAITKCPPKNIGMGTIVRAANLANPKWDETITLDDFHAYVPENKFIYVPTGDLWSAASVDSQLQKIAIKPNKTMKASARLNKNKPTHQRAWAPGEPEVVRGRLFKDGAWEPKLGHNCFNLYRPPTIITPEGKIDATPWEQHVQRVYKDHAAHIINYLAHRVQKSGEKPNHALVMVGSPGCGKDTLLEPVRYAVGPWNVASIRPKDLFEQFNEYVQSVLLIINETRDLGEASRTEFYEHMKIYTAAPPPVLRCNPKHLSPFYVMNVCGVIYPTNHANGLYLPSDDRRHYVASTDVTAEDLGGEKYFNELWEWYYKKQGFEHVAAFLAKHPLKDFNPFAPPPKTEAFWTMVRAHQSVEEDDLAQAIDTLGTPAALTLDCLRDTAPALKEWIDDNLRGPAIPNLLRQHDYVAFPNPGDKTKGLWFIAGDRQRVYVQRMLDGRGQHDALKALKTRREKRVTKKGVDDLI